MLFISVLNDQKYEALNSDSLHGAVAHYDRITIQFVKGFGKIREVAAR